ncbi:hypothetical protein ACCO45_013005 [Purpureocillium lilacinum]|uniref:Uncharacterized protein n=1 Tax=Purpureocillium lilacinum TaxID=33203 RepID=A0ACC4D9N4_PURLI
MHYYMPPGNRIVELMTDGETDERIFPFLVERLREIGMHPFVARKESTGLIFNRLWAAIKREVLNILAEEVSTPEEVERMWKEMYVNNHSGPVAMMDAVGLDTVSFIEQHYIDERGCRTRLSSSCRATSTRASWAPSHPRAGFSPGRHDEGRQRLARRPRQRPLPAALPARHWPLHQEPPGRLPRRPRARRLAGRPTTQGPGLEPAHPRRHRHLPLSGQALLDEHGHPIAKRRRRVQLQPRRQRRHGHRPRGAVHTPKQLTVDSINSKLYFSDREGLRVMRCAFDGSGLEVLVQTGDWRDESHQADQTRWCVGVTVSPATGKFYWTQKGPSKGGKGRIFRADMVFRAGETAASRSDVELLFQNLPEPIDLEVDEAENMLYWTDRGELPLGNSINRAKLETVHPAEAPSRPGKDYEVIARDMHEAIGIKLDPTNRHIYTTDLGGTVYRLNLDGGDRKKLYEGSGAIAGITLAYV